MSFAVGRDIGSQLLIKAAAAGRLVAAGTGDATEITGQTIDRMGARGQMYQSAKIAAAYHCVLTDTKTLSIGLKIQESADGSNWDTAEVIYAATVVATAANPALEFTGVKVTDLDLSSRKRYVRFNPTPDLNHSGTDVAEIAVTVTLGGGAVLPAA